MVRIKDVAAQLGVSSTTVSNVIHGKTNRVSPELVAKIQEVLAKENYVPNMAGVLLAQSNSRIIAIVLCNDVKYGDRMLQDPFISELLGGMEASINEKEYFTMLHNTRDINEVAKIASMWNVAGLILFGFEKEDYEALRKKVKVPFVTIDAYFESEIENYVNVGVDDFQGGYKMGKYLVENGHEKIMYLVEDNSECYKERFAGLKKAYEEKCLEIERESMPLLSSDIKERRQMFESMANEILEGKNDYSAVFFGADSRAIEAMNIFQDFGINIPEDISVSGFDDTSYASVVRPYLTTIRQDILLKSVVVTNTLMNLINKYKAPGKELRLPVEIVVRNSVKDIKADN